MKTQLHAYWYTRNFSELKHGLLDVTYEDGTYKSETPEFPCDIPDGDEAYELHEYYLNMALGDEHNFYFFTKEADEKAAYAALDKYYQEKLSNAKAAVVILESQCEKIRKMNPNHDAIIKAMLTGMMKN